MNSRQNFKSIAYLFLLILYGSGGLQAQFRVNVQGPAGRSEQATSLLPLSDGTFIVTAVANDLTGNNTGALVGRYEADGTQLWLREFAYSGMQLSGLSAVSAIELDDQNILIAGGADELASQLAFVITPAGSILSDFAYEDDSLVSYVRQARLDRSNARSPLVTMGYTRIGNGQSDMLLTWLPLDDLLNNNLPLTNDHIAIGNGFENFPHHFLLNGGEASIFGYQRHGNESEPVLVVYDQGSVLPQSSIYENGLANSYSFGNSFGHGIRLLDGDYIAVGHCQGPDLNGNGSSSIHVLVMRLDGTTGDIEWQRSYLPNTGVDARGLNIIPAEGGYYVYCLASPFTNLSGTGDDPVGVDPQRPTAGNGSTEAFILFLDESGNVIWSRKIQDNADNTAYAFPSMTELGGQMLISVSATSAAGSTDEDLQIAGMIASDAPDGTCVDNFPVATFTSQFSRGACDYQTFNITTTLERPFIKGFSQSTQPVYSCSCAELDVTLTTRPQIVYAYANSGFIFQVTNTGNVTANQVQVVPAYDPNPPYTIIHSTPPQNIAPGGSASFTVTLQYTANVSPLIQDFLIMDANGCDTDTVRVTYSTIAGGCPFSWGEETVNCDNQDVASNPVPLSYTLSTHRTFADVRRIDFCMDYDPALMSFTAASPAPDPNMPAGTTIINLVNTGSTISGTLVLGTQVDLYASVGGTADPIISQMVKLEFSLFRLPPAGTCFLAFNSCMTTLHGPGGTTPVPTDPGMLFITGFSCGCPPGDASFTIAGEPSCAGTPAIFTATETSGSHVWRVGANNNQILGSTGSVAGFQYNTPGIYTVTHTVILNGIPTTETQEHRVVLCTSSGLKFDGIDDRVTGQHGGVASFNNQTAWALQMIVRPEITQNTNRPVLFSRTAGNQEFVFGIETSSGKLYCRNFNGPVRVNTSGPSVMDGQCHFVGLQRNGNTFTFFVDEVPTGSFSSSTTRSSTAPVVVGNSSGNQAYKGYIDDVQLIMTGEAYVPALGWSLQDGYGQVVYDEYPSDYKGWLGSTAAVEANDPIWAVPGCEGSTVGPNPLRPAVLTPAPETQPSIIPNPNSGAFHLQYPVSLDTPAQLQVFSVTGQLIWEENTLLQPDEPLHAIELPDAPAGIYLLVITHDHIRETLKFQIR